MDCRGGRGLFNLNRCVINVETVARNAVHALDYCTSVQIAAAYHDVATHGQNTRSQRPDVQIVHRTHAFNVFQLCLQIHDIDMRRRSFKKDIYGVANQYPGTGKNQETDDTADDGVRHIVAAP